MRKYNFNDLYNEWIYAFEIIPLFEKQEVLETMVENNCDVFEAQQILIKEYKEDLQDSFDKERDYYNSIAIF